MKGYVLVIRSSRLADQRKGNVQYSRSNLFDPYNPVRTIPTAVEFDLDLSSFARHIADGPSLPDFDEISRLRIRMYRQALSDEFFVGRCTRGIGIQIRVIRRLRC